MVTLCPIPPVHPTPFSALRPGGSLLQSACCLPCRLASHWLWRSGGSSWQLEQREGAGWILASPALLWAAFLWQKLDPCMTGSLQAAPSPWLPLSLGFCWAISAPSTLGGDGNDNTHPCWAPGATASSVCPLIPPTPLHSFPLFPGNICVLPGCWLVRPLWFHSL